MLSSFQPLDVFALREHRRDEGRIRGEQSIPCTGNSERRNRHGALLRGLLHCKACNKAMVHTYTSKSNKRYRYYTCSMVMKKGRRKCPTESLPAGEIEKAVLDQIRCIGQDPELLKETLQQARLQSEEAIKRLTEERSIIERGLLRCQTEIKRLAADGTVTEEKSARLLEVTDQVRQSERRLAEIDNQLADHKREIVTDEDVAAAFADFDNLWTSLTPREQARVIQLLVSRVTFDASDSTIEVSFHASGIKALGDGDVGLASETEHETKAAPHVEDATERNVARTGTPVARDTTVSKTPRRTKEAAA